MVVKSGGFIQKWWNKVPPCLLYTSCLYHEHPAECQFDEDRTGGTGINDRRYHIKCALLSASEPKKEGHLSKVEDIRNDLCYNSGHKCGRIQTYNAGG